MDLNMSSLKWCSLINCNWCVSLDISKILALMVTIGDKCEQQACIELKSLLGTIIAYGNTRLLSYRFIQRLLIASVTRPDIVTGH